MSETATSDTVTAVEPSPHLIEGLNPSQIEAVLAVKHRHSRTKTAA
jgi:hypothetical protein